MYATITVLNTCVKFQTENNFTGSEPLYPDGKYKPVRNVLKKIKRLLKNYGVTGWETHYEEYPSCSWDTCDLSESEINYIVKEGGYEERKECQDENGKCLSEDEIRDIVYSDSCISETWWNQFTEDLNENVRKVFKVSQEVAITSPATGWTRAAGGKLINIDRDDNPCQSILNVLPDCEKTIQVFERKNSEYGHHLAIKVSHHDSMGDMYYVYRKKYLSGIDKKHLTNK